MKKLMLTVLCISIINLSFSQDNYKVGIGFGFDLGVNFIDNQNYEVSLPEYGSTASVFSMDIFTKVPIKYGINFYPTIGFTISKGIYSIENLNGDFMPEGYSVQIPYSTVGNGWSVSHYSDDYEYFLSDGYTSHTNFGGFLTKNITDYFEIGTGLFYKIKTQSVDNFNAYDEYIWSSSTGTQYDNYSYVETHVQNEPFETDSSTNSGISVPIILKFNLNYDKMFMGLSFISYISDDTYYSIRLTTGFNIKAKSRNSKYD